jgi:hypothetical protein
MAETDIWLARFGDHHDHVDNAGIYWASLSLLLTGIVGLLWSLPVSRELTAVSPLLNWGSLFLMAALVYYFVISIPLGAGMLPFVWGIGAIQAWLAARSMPIAVTSCILAGAGVAGFSLGHYASGGIRGVLRDVQLVMIAPLWLLSKIYRQLGIPY